MPNFFCQIKILHYSLGVKASFNIMPKIISYSVHKPYYYRALYFTEPQIFHCFTNNNRIIIQIVHYIYYIKQYHVMLI